MNYSYCFCPNCGETDDNWNFATGNTYVCDNCGEKFADLDAAWWYSAMQREFWDGVIECLR